MESKHVPVVAGRLSDITGLPEGLLQSASTAHLNPHHNTLSLTITVALTADQALEAGKTLWAAEHSSAQRYSSRSFTNHITPSRLADRLKEQP